MAEMSEASSNTALSNETEVGEKDLQDLKEIVAAERGGKNTNGSFLEVDPEALGQYSVSELLSIAGGIGVNIRGLVEKDEIVKAIVKSVSDNAFGDPGGGMSAPPAASSHKRTDIFSQQSGGANKRIAGVAANSTTNNNDDAVAANDAYYSAPADAL